MNARIDRRHFLAALGASAGLLTLGKSGSAADLPLLDLDSLVGADGVAWEKVRRGFSLAEGLAYFNCGSLGPSPNHVLREIWTAWETLERDPADEAYGRMLGLAEEVRKKAAAFLGCTTGEMIVTQNTTEGMNAVAQGIDWKRGDCVLTADHEHPGGLVGWQYFARKQGVTINSIKLPLRPRDAGAIIDRIGGRGRTTATCCGRAGCCENLTGLTL